MPKKNIEKILHGIERQITAIEKDPTKLSYEIVEVKLTEIIREFPRSSRAYALRAKVNGKLKKNAERIADFEQAAFLSDPRNPELFFTCGTLLNAAKRYNEAIPMFNHCLEGNPNHAKAYNNLGFAHGCLGRYDDAIGFVETAIKKDPKGSFYFNLAMLTLKKIEINKPKDLLKAYDDILKNIDVALKSDPENKKYLKYQEIVAKKIADIKAELQKLEESQKKEKAQEQVQPKAVDRTMVLKLSLTPSPSPDLGSSPFTLPAVTRSERRDQLMRVPAAAQAQSKADGVAARKRGFFGEKDSTRLPKAKEQRTDRALQNDEDQVMGSSHGDEANDQAVGTHAWQSPPSLTFSTPPTPPPSKLKL